MHTCTCNRYDTLTTKEVVSINIGDLFSRWVRICTAYSFVWVRSWKTSISYD